MARIAVLLRSSYMRTALATVMALALAPAAYADTTTKACQANGRIDFAPAMQLIGGSGQDWGVGQEACVINGAPGLGTFTAAGTYVSTVCGTFTMTWTSGATIEAINWHGTIFHSGAPAGTIDFVPSGASTTTCATSAEFDGSWVYANT